MPPEDWLPDAPPWPDDWLVLPGTPWLPDEPELPEDPWLPGEPDEGDELGIDGGDDEVDPLLIAQPASAAAIATTANDHDCLRDIWLDSVALGRRIASRFTPDTSTSIVPGERWFNAYRYRETTRSPCRRSKGHRLRGTTAAGRTAGCRQYAAPAK